MGEGLVVRDGETGDAVIAATRLPVERILEGLARGGSLEALLALHPGLTPEHVTAALRFAAEAVRGVPPAAGADGRRTVVVDAKEYAELRYQVGYLKGICQGLVEAAGRVLPAEVTVAGLLPRTQG
jgi:uncharacterized protein (DUF433 family)